MKITRAEYEQYKELGDCLQSRAEEVWDIYARIRLEYKIQPAYEVDFQRVENGRVVFRDDGNDQESFPVEWLFIEDVEGVIRTSLQEQKARVEEVEEANRKRAEANERKHYEQLKAKYEKSNTAD